MTLTSSLLDTAQKPSRVNDLLGPVMKVQREVLCFG
jgi:hypothetical protein